MPNHRQRRAVQPLSEQRLADEVVRVRVLAIDVHREIELLHRVGGLAGVDQRLAPQHATDDRVRVVPHALLAGDDRAIVVSPIQVGARELDEHRARRVLLEHLLVLLDHRLGHI